MRKRQAVVWVTALLACLSGLDAAAASEGARRRPNVVVIVGDDMGYADIGVHGCKDIPTPHIDSIAKNGVRCSSGYVTGPYCSPTRAALLTGRYQQRFGHEFNPGPPNDQNAEIGLSLNEKTMADRLRAAGYATGMVGKWHLGHVEKFNPVHRGFQEFFGFLGGGHPYFPTEVKNNPILRGTTVVEEKEYLTDAFAREAVSYVDRHKAEPFFLYLAFNAVHTPMHATPKYLERFKDIPEGNRRTYAAMMSAMDDAVGAVLAKLREEKLDEHTLVFFISDNGGPPANASSNAPLNGRKATTWEGGIRVPFLVQWTGRLPAGKVYDHPVAQIDILPTALAAAGVKAEAEQKFDGVGLAPYLSGQQSRPPHEALFWRFGPQAAVRSGDWKLVKANANAARPLRRPDVAQWQLYNLADDVGEQNDLAEKEPERVKELSAAWDKWNAELAPPAWDPPRNNQRQQQRQNRQQRRQQQQTGGAAVPQ